MSSSSTFAGLFIRFGGGGGGIRAESRDRLARACELAILPVLSAQWLKAHVEFHLSNVYGEEDCDT